MPRTTTSGLIRSSVFTAALADPKEQVCSVYMTQAPSPVRAAYRRAMHLELAFFDAALLPSG